MNEDSVGNGRRRRIPLMGDQGAKNPRSPPFCKIWRTADGVLGSALRAGHVDAVPVRCRRSHLQFLEAPLEGLHEPHDRQNPGKRVQAGNPLHGEVPLAEPVQFEKSGKSRREGQKGIAGGHVRAAQSSEENTSEPQSLMRTSSAVFCSKKKKTTK